MQNLNGRGAWHLHIIYIFPKKAPFIENSILYDIWQQNGWVSIKKLTGISNVGVYLTSYLCNLDTSKFFEMSSNIDENQKKKAIIKGARLQLYPTNFRIYSCSRGIKKPQTEKMTNYQAMQEVKGQALTFEKTIKLTEDEKIINIINYKHYNKIAKFKK